MQTANILEQDANIKEAAFYDQDFYFSPTSSNKLLSTPREFYKEYILKEKEIKRDKHLVLGTLTHFFILEGVDFTTHFAVAPEGVPTGKGKETVEAIFDIVQRRISLGAIPPGKYALEEFETEILEYMDEIDFYTNIKDQEKRVAKVYDPKLKDYFDFLMDSTESKKELVDAGMVDLASKKAEVIMADEKISDLLGLKKQNSETYRVFDEFDHQMKLEGFPFGLKGRIDNMTIDVPTKTITVNDLKTTGGTLQDFKESVVTWNYGLQAAFYDTLARDCVKAFVDDSWTFKFNFVVIDKYNHVYAFPVTDKTMASWKEDMKQALLKLKYHYEKAAYHLPYEYAIGEVEL